VTHEKASGSGILPSMKPSESVNIMNKDRRQMWLRDSFCLLKEFGLLCCSELESSMSVSSD
jgi:hypothetical protein